MNLQHKIQSAAAKLKNDSLNYARNKNMFGAGAITKSQLDQAELALQVSTADFKSAVAEYQNSQNQLHVDLQNAQSNLTSSGTDLANYMITSMIGGELYETTKELGEAVKKNEQVALIGEKDHKILQLSVDQQDIEKIKLGQEVDFKMDVTGDKVYKAKISKIYPNMNQSDQSFKVEAEFDDNYNFSFVHASVEANIIVGHKDKALLIPKDAVQAGDEVELKGLGLYNKVKIKKGLETLEYVEVLDGLKDSAEVVIPAPKKISKCVPSCLMLNLSPVRIPVNFDIAKTHLLAKKRQTFCGHARRYIRHWDMYLLMISFMSGFNEYLEDSMLSATPDVRIYNDIKTDYSHSILDDVSRYIVR